MRLLAILAFLPCIALGQIDLTGAYIGTRGDVLPSTGFQIRLGGDRYLWGSYSRHGQIEQTQRLGTAFLYGAGVGYRQQFQGFTLYAEAGIGYLDTKYSNRVLREIVYYKFQPIFGDPPFLPIGGRWDSLTHLYRPDPIAPLIRVGALYPMTNRVSIELGYRYFVTDVYFSMWNPNLNGGPSPANLDACGCLWEGQSQINAGGPFLGLNYRF